MKIHPPQKASDNKNRGLEKIVNECNIWNNCERYSIYRSTIFGEDDLLWEETSCDYDSVRLEERFKEKMAYYTDLYSGSYVYKEHVTYSQ